MKLPVIRHIQQTFTDSQLMETIQSMELIAEARGWKEEELNVIGEIITSLCGAIEVNDMIAAGVRPTDALNNFAQKVIGSVD